MNKICGIYKITSPTNKIYIGSSKDINTRWSRYKNLHCQYQQKIYRSLLKHSVDAHKFEIIHECNAEDLFQWERLYAEYYDVLGANGLNLAIPNYKDIKGKRSQECKDLMSFKMTGSKNHFYGKKHTVETIQKLKGKPSYFIGKKHSKEVIEKIRAAKIGKKYTNESKLKMSESRKKFLNNGGLVHNSKIIINLTTGIFYDSITDAAISHNINRRTLGKKIKRKTITNFIYA
jgi:group I intron endonuclease